MNITVYRNLPAPTHVTVDYPRDLTCLVVTWTEIVSMRKQIIRYNVYRAYSMHGAYVLLNDHPITSNRYEDRDLSLNPNVDCWYKVTALYEQGDQLVEGNFSEPANFQVHNTDKWMWKINERNLWILINVGQLFDLYTRKYAGEPCPRCNDTIHGRASTNECPVCYGTGFVGGYEPMCQLYVRLKPVELTLNVSNQMYVQENTPGAWTITDIRLANRDLLVAPNGTMYHVLSAMVNHAAGKLFHTELRLRVLDPLDPLYKMRRTKLYPREIYREQPPMSEPFLGGAAYIDPARDA